MLGFLQKIYIFRIFTKIFRKIYIVPSRIFPLNVNFRFSLETHPHREENAFSSCQKQSGSKSSLFLPRDAKGNFLLRRENLGFLENYGCDTTFKMSASPQ